MGNGYIRYENGLQICYGTVQITASLTTAWGSLYEANTSSITAYTFPKAFKSVPWLSATVSSGNAAFIEVAKATTTTASVTYLARPNSGTITSSIDYIAIGTWK